MENNMELPAQFKKEVTVGEYTFELPDCPKDKKQIMGWNLKVPEQKWERPSDILGEKAFDVLSDDKKVEYLTREFKRRREGFWFYNCGKITYLTGHHYFFLVYWRLPEGFAIYKDSDRDFFWLYDYSERLDNCYGLLQLTNRRDGKTARSTAVIYNTVTLNKESVGGIQSKTGPDAKIIFKKLISSWKKLEHYMKPVDSGDTNPQQELKFEEPGTRTNKSIVKKYKDVINSVIGYKPSNEEAYDGTKLKFYYDDEIGKTTEVDIYNRWLIVKECLTIGRRIVGKSLHTSTVEEMEKAGGENCYRLWNDSDLQEAIKIGRTMTQSGLLRYFKPATEGLTGFIDEYGRSVIEDPIRPIMGIDGIMIEEGALTFIKKQRIGLSPVALASNKRKYPLDIDEAFYMDGKDSSFDVIRLNEQIEYNNSLSQSFITKGNFVWKDEAHTKVDFLESESGRFSVIWFPEAQDRNCVTSVLGVNKPGNYRTLSGGVDPFDHRYTTDTRKSNGAFYIFKKFDLMNDDFSKTFVCEYVNRPANPEDFYEDILKACVFYGCELLAETNKIGLVNYFRTKGYEMYLMDRPKSTHVKFSKTKQKEKGIPMNSADVRQHLIEMFESYIINYVGYMDESETYGKMYFNKLCKCLIQFKSDKWTDYDEFVAAALAMVGSTRYDNVAQFEDKPKTISIYVKIYGRRRPL
jgi:hypothetical protein